MEAPRKYDHKAILQDVNQVAIIREAGLSDFEYANTAVVEAEDVAIVAKASNAHAFLQKWLDGTLEDRTRCIPACPEEVSHC